MGKHPQLSVIIPAYNEENRLPDTIGKVCDYLTEQDYLSEIIIVDDGSSDHTPKTTLPNYQDPILNIKIHQHSANQGKGAAVKTGVSLAQGQFLLYTDADNSTPIGELDKLLPYLTQTPKFDYDIAIGSRHLPDSTIKIHQPLYRKALSRAANKLIQVLLLPGIVDTQCGFKLFKHEAAKQIFAKSTIDRWGYDMEILYIAKRLGYKIKEIPVIWLNSPYSRVRTLFGPNSALNTFKELLQIKWNAWMGRYQ